MTHRVSSKSSPQCFGPSYGLKHLANYSIISDRLNRLNSDISKFRHFATTLPRADPVRIGSIQALAITLKERYRLLTQLDDLGQSILHFTEAILLPHPGHLYRHCPNIIQNFYSTAQLLILRALHTIQTNSLQPEDVKRPVIYLRYLRGQPPEALNILPDLVHRSLVDTLALQLKLELGDMMQDIEEMASLLLESLNSDIRTTWIGAIISFAGVVKLRHLRWGPRKKPPAKVIDCLRKAIIRLVPDSSDDLSITLACTLFDRICIAYSNDDYEEGTAILNRFLTSHAPGNDPSQYREALNLISHFALVRLNACEKPEHVEEAIYRFRNLLPWIPHEDPYRRTVVNYLKLIQLRRLDDSLIGRLQKELKWDPACSGGPSFWDLNASLESPSKKTELELQVQRMKALIYASRMTDMAEIEAAIEPCRRLLAFFHPGDMFRSDAVGAFGKILFSAFEFTNNIEYVNEAISILRGGPMVRNTVSFGVAPLLLKLHSIRFNLRHSRQDLIEIMRLHRIVADDVGIKIPHRFKYSCDWARLARSYSDPCTSTAYHYALSLMRDSLTFTPTVEIQHSRLVSMRDNYENLPLDRASYQVHTGDLKSAVETLEQGRALIWSEMRGLRSSIDQLRASDPDLADKFAAINQGLENLTLISAQNNYGDGEEEVLEGMDPYGHLVVRQRGLVDGREKLISQIRARHGFESFLKPPSFDNLRSATVRGPVIMINNCRWRSDILLLLYDSPPSLIPTANDFYDRANELRDQLLGARTKGLESVEYEDALRSVLKELYELVGHPVIQRLNELDIPEQSRVWWYPTSAFCSLPLHAMGPIPSDSDPPRYFLDLYIPSYTPTLSALIESNRSGSHILGKPSLLLVAQQDESMKAALGEVRVVQSVNTQVKTLISARATPTAVPEHLRDHRFVHIICHGILEPGKPFDSSFKLYGGNRLALLDIIRSRLPNAEFAFLAACHTAELTDGSLSDEALHLTAAMQYCGFRSVVGTMWAMADKDGPHLAQNFYNSIFPAGEGQGACYYERTAEALRDAVIKLRGRTGEGMSLERWVNFVHYGA